MNNLKGNVCLLVFFKEQKRENWLGEETKDTRRLEICIERTEGVWSDKERLKDCNGIEEEVGRGWYKHPIPILRF